MSPRPVILDLFCCQGGAAAGYHAAGFDVVGVDVEPQPRYPYEFIQADALEFAAAHAHKFAAAHASPPCQAYSTMTGAARDKHPRLIAPTREVLRASGVPYVIENVVGARSELVSPALLCGSSFALRVRRHRLFETNWLMLALQCQHDLQPDFVGVYGGSGERRQYHRADGSPRRQKASSLADAVDALGGVDWMDWHGASQSIPPAFTEFIGGQLINQVTPRKVTL